MVVEGVAAVAEMVEKVATATDEMAEEMAEKLPEKNKLKQVASVLEHISEVAAHEAHLTQDFLHKVNHYTLLLKLIYEIYIKIVLTLKDQFGGCFGTTKYFEYLIYVFWVSFIGLSFGGCFGTK